MIKSGSTLQGKTREKWRQVFKKEIHFFKKWKKRKDARSDSNVNQRSSIANGANDQPRPSKASKSFCEAEGTFR